MSTNDTYNPKTSSSSKIPPFDEKNFSMWKTKALYVLESMDEFMLDIVNDGPHQPMYQPMKDRVADGPMKPASKDLWTSKDKHLVSLDVRGRSAISNSLPYNTFHLVQNCESSKDMLDTLTVAFEGTEEVRATTLTNLIRQYEQFFAKKDETLTHTFTRFNCLINDLKRYEEIKHNYVLVINFLDSLGSQWDHYSDVLKNSEKIKKMDLQSLYGNLRYHEESKLQRKEMMKESHRDKSIALYTKRTQVPDSESDNSSPAESEEDMDAVYASAALIVRRFGKPGRNVGGPRKPDHRTSSSSFRRSDSERKSSEKRNDGKCFNCNSSDHFSRDCPVNKDESEETYKAKYEKLVAKLKKQKMEDKVLIAEQEKWETDDESSEEENITCLMAQIHEDTDSEVSSESTFDTDMSKAIRDSKRHDIDSSSVYQVENFKTYNLNEKIAMFEYVCVQLAKSSELNGELKAKIQTLNNDILKQNSALSELNTKYRDTCLTNDSLYLERDQALTHSIKFQSITETWLKSHENLNYIISVQIPD